MRYLKSYDDFLFENLDRSEYRPLARILECRYTPDRKHLVFEGSAYCSETGEIVPMNESWSLSDILHAGADVLSMGLDFVIPGSGAIVDVLHALSYIIEAQFVDPEKRGSLYLMSAITFAFVILPGPLQAVSIPLKQFIKNGAKAASPLIKSALATLGKFMPKILKAVPDTINSALKSPLAKGLLGKWAGKIGAAVKSWGDNVASSFNKIMGRPDTAKNFLKTSLKEVLSGPAVTSLKKFFAKAEIKVAPKVGEKALKKLGYVAGKPYRYINKQGKGVTARIVGSGVDGKSLLVKFGNKPNLAPTSVPIETFLRQSIGAPWGRRGYSVAAPLAVKQFSRMLNDAGEIDPVVVEQIPALDPNVVSTETMSYYLDEVPEYDGTGEGIPVPKT
jgi:hypothetical protein